MQTRGQERRNNRGRQAVPGTRESYPPVKFNRPTYPSTRKRSSTSSFPRRREPESPTFISLVIPRRKFKSRSRNAGNGFWRYLNTFRFEIPTRKVLKVSFSLRRRFIDFDVELANPELKSVGRKKI